jgi:hypothetical protein
MPPDGDHLNHRAKMYQRSPPEKGRLNVASSSGERATRDDEGKDRENPPTKVSRRVRDLLIAIFAALSVSYLVTCFRPSPDLFGASPMVLEQQQHGVPSAESYQAASTSSENVLQVVNTRFQQNQPHFKTLGKARLELFKAFCLPSMIRQSNQDFLWLIQTDPDLDVELMNEMKQLLAPYPHFYLIHSKSVKKRPITRNWKIRLHFNESDIVSGDKQVLMKASKDSTDKILIETNLDADDGLAYYVLQDIRDDFVRRLKPVAEQVFSIRKNGWVVGCYHQFIGWYPDYSTKSKDYGGLRIDLRHDKFCPTPGLTIASVPKANTTGVYLSKHNEIVRRIPRCKSHEDFECLYGVGEIPSTVRARTPSSAGMDNIGEKFGHTENVQHLWAYLDHLFGISREDVAQAGRYFLENSNAIARENLEGLCVPGTYKWTCKEEVKEKLKKLIESENI